MISGKINGAVFMKRTSGNLRMAVKHFSIELKSTGINLSAGLDERGNSKGSKTPGFQKCNCSNILRTNSDHGFAVVR